MSSREERIDIFQDTLNWINEDYGLSDSIAAAKKNTTVFYPSLTTKFHKKSRYH